MTIKINSFELDFYPTRYLYLKFGKRDWIWERN